jgi:DCN1-like protein 1/2
MSLSNRPSQRQDPPPTGVYTVESATAVDESTACDDSDASIKRIVKSGVHAVNDVPILLSVPQLANGVGASHLEQHRIRAEHLSRVLHNNLTLANITNLPESEFTLRRHTRYGSLGTHTDTLQHLRSITTPVPPTHLANSKPESLLAILDINGATSLHASASDHQLRSQSTMSLRGGSGSNFPRQKPNWQLALEEIIRDDNAWLRMNPGQSLQSRYDTQTHINLGPRPTPLRRTSPVLIYIMPTANSCNISSEADHLHSYYSGNSGGGAQASSAAKANLTKLFDRYQEAGAPDKDIVGVEGTMRYFEETGVDAEGLEALAALEIVQAPTMGEMSRDGFVKGWSERR